MKTIKIKVTESEKLLDITKTVKEYVKECQIKEGFVHLQLPERASALTIGINDDWRFEGEFFKKLNHLMPRYNGMMFTGWTTMNVKSSIFGLTLQVLVSEGTLMLEKNQSIYFIEFNGPGERSCFLSHMGSYLAPDELAQMPEELKKINQVQEEKEEELKKVQEEMRNEWQIKDAKQKKALEKKQKN